MSQTESLYSVAYQFNPECLKIAREFRGLQKNKLAALLGVTPSAITQFESGAVRPNPQTIARLSLALNFPATFFSQSKEMVAISSDQCYFRSLKSCSQGERRKMTGAGSILGRIVEFLDEHVHLPQENVSRIQGKSFSFEDIERTAGEVRAAWGLGNGPIENVVDLLEANGILIFRLFEDCKKVDAFSAWHKGRPLIFLNSEKGSGSRSRYDACHELGHLVMHADCIPGDRVQEDQANRFSGAFMLPRDSFIRECPNRLKWPHLIELKERWKVSLSAIVRRGRDLGIYSEDTYRRAYMQMNKMGWRTSEPAEPEIETSTIFSRAVALLEKTGWSLGKIAEQLSLREPDLRILTSYE